MCECLAEMLCTVGSKRGKAEVAARATRVTMAAVSTSMYSSLLSPMSTTRARSGVVTNRVLCRETDDLHSCMGLPQEGIYYKWASVKMTLKFHFLWSTLF